MDGKVLIRWLKVICVVALFGVILFYQGQSSPGCPGGGSTPPGCNPGGGGGGGSSTPTDCAKIDKPEDCNNKPDCGWYQPPQGQQATPQPTNEPSICTKDEYKNNKNECEGLIRKGCVFDGTCKTWKQYCDEKKETNQQQCTEKKYDGQNSICKWSDTEPKCQANTPPEAAPLPSGQKPECMKVDKYCAHIPEGDCNDDKTNKKCEWFEGQCKPKSTQQLCGSKQGNDCNNTPGCILDGSSCITIEAFCDQASGTTGEGKGEEACGKKMKNGEKVCEWVGGENKCKPKKGATRTNCSWGWILKVELGNDTAQCPEALQQICPCNDCFTVEQNKEPEGNNKAKGYGFVRYGDKIGVLCCNGLYKNDSVTFPTKDDPQAQINDYLIVDPFDGNLKPANTLEDASKYCKRIWNGFNVDIQTNVKIENGKTITTYVGANKQRCGKEDGKNAVRCIDVKRNITKDGKTGEVTTKHIFCCNKDEYLNTYLIKIKASTQEPSTATELSEAKPVKLPYVDWDGNTKKLWQDKPDGSNYGGPTSQELKNIVQLISGISPVCESCSINIDKNTGKIETPKTIIEKIYNFYYEKMGINSFPDADKTPADNFFLAEDRGKDQYFKYFFGYGVNDDYGKLKKELLRISDKRSCNSTKQGATDDDHFSCCWWNGIKDDAGVECKPNDCKDCRIALKKVLFKRIADKLEAICKNIQGGESTCEKKPEADCKNILACTWDGSCKQALLPEGDIAPSIAVEYDGGGKKIENVTVSKDFFSSQRCGTDE